MTSQGVSDAALAVIDVEKETVSVVITIEEISEPDKSINLVTLKRLWRSLSQWHLSDQKRPIICWTNKMKKPDTMTTYATMRKEAENATDRKTTFRLIREVTRVREEAQKGCIERIGNN